MESWGAVVDVAENGQAALDKFDALKHRLVLMDLHMPVMDGYESIRRLRAAGFDLPVIALTASSNANENNRLSDMNVMDIVLKPFEPEVLLAAILKIYISDYAFVPLSASLCHSLVLSFVNAAFCMRMTIPIQYAACICRVYDNLI